MYNTRMNTLKPQDVTFARVEFATITRVHPRNHSVDVLTEFTHRPLPDLPIVTPYLGRRGSGISAGPAAGDKCYITIPGDGSGPYVSGFVVVGESYYQSEQDGGDWEAGTDEDGPDYSGGRPPLEAGDLALTTADGNFIHVRAGGMVQVGSTALCQTFFIPTENIIRHFFQRLEGESPLGNYSWGHASIESGIEDDDETAVIVRYNIRDIIQDEDASLEIRLGRIDTTTVDTEDEGHHLMGDQKDQEGLGMDPGTSSLSFALNYKGSSIKYVFQLDETGNAFMKAGGDVHMEIKRGLYVRASKGFRFEESDEVYLQIKESEFKAHVNTLVLDAVRSITIKSETTTIDSSNVSIGSGAAKFPAIMDRGFLAWAENHTHPIPTVNVAVAGAAGTTAPGFTTAPIVPPPNAASSHVKLS